MSLPQQSKKRLAAIADGTFVPKARKAMKRSTFTAKEGAALLKKAKTPKASRSKAMKAADKWFSEFIRLRDAGPDGRVKCITCQRVAHWRDMDCGHYASRAKQSTRYDEKNANAQCGGCNRFQGGKFIEHAIAIDRKYPKDFGSEAAVIAYKAMKECKRTTSDFLFIADTYKKRVDWIKQHEPEKYERCAG